MLLPAGQGGYDLQRGWDKRAKSVVPLTHVPDSQPLAGIEDDNRSIRSWQSLAEHTDKVVRQLELILAELSLPQALAQQAHQAAVLHDVGKAHPVFQQTMLGDPPQHDTQQLWAKTVLTSTRHSRRGFRHELASALALLQHGYPTLVAYLVAAHHGKLRLAIRPLPHEQPPAEDPDRPFALGIWQGDGPCAGLAITCSTRSSAATCLTPSASA